MTKVKNNLVDWIAGSVVILVGVATLWGGQTFPIGTARSMGPGYFPVALGILLIVFGLGIILVEGRRGRSEGMERIAVRGVVAIMCAIGAFAFLIERVGLVPAVFAVIMLSAMAERPVRWLSALALSAGMSVAATLIFIVGLKLPLKVIGW